MTRDEIELAYPGYLKARKFPPGYENDEALLPRIRKGLREVVDNVAGNRIIVTAHGGIIYCIEASVGLPFRHMPTWVHAGSTSTRTATSSWVTASSY